MRSILPVVVALVLAAGLVAVVYGLARRSSRVTQPIAFNHQLHLDEAGLECLDCHSQAETRVHAGLPGKTMCFDCHDVDEEFEEGSELAKLVAFDEGDADIPWVRVAVTKPDVFFSHRRHVAAGGIECLRCHPGQPELTAPPFRVDQVMAMDDCIACHQEHQASTDCLACHR